MNRKQFISRISGGAVLIALTSSSSFFINACSNTSNPVNSQGGVASLPVIQGTAGTNTITLAIGATSPLAAVNSVALIQNGSSRILVKRISDTSFLAVSAICTHAGCVITEYTISGAAYVCPCHGSQFHPDGTVLQGPASSGLTTYPTQFANGQLTVTIK
ncbi:MAG: Rieske 2Fe-2S domain-containing protein [Ignavibacteria bacterium]|nr:Rieske 2Fe-2S domain-containing protein [Ignavibacteria bacterium]